jgi:hypothetical protein
MLARRIHLQPHFTTDELAARYPLLRQVATDFPRSRAEVWAIDEHRIVWRYLVGFIHPALGRTIFHLLLQRQLSDTLSRQEVAWT